MYKAHMGYREKVWKLFDQSENSDLFLLSAWHYALHKELNLKCYRS